MIIGQNFLTIFILHLVSRELRTQSECVMQDSIVHKGVHRVQEARHSFFYVIALARMLFFFLLHHHSSYCFLCRVYLYEFLRTGRGWNKFARRRLSRDCKSFTVIGVVTPFIN